MIAGQVMGDEGGFFRRSAPKGDRGARSGDSNEDGRDRESKVGTKLA